MKEDSFFYEELEKLISVSKKLTLEQVQLLLKLGCTMSMPVEPYVNPASDILSNEFVTSISNQLIAHHAVQESKLNKKSFEYLFKYACEASGSIAIINENTTNPGEDIIVDETKFSLKTQADKSVKTNSGLYIQKLMEARWMRDCHTREELAEEAKKRITSHLSKYERIIMLRAFDLQHGKFRYQLIEIPKNLLLLIGKLDKNSFSEKNKAGSSGANVYDENGIAFRILLDGSVEKVRIFNIRTSRCFLHGEWLIPYGMQQITRISTDQHSLFE